MHLFCIYPIYAWDCAGVTWTDLYKIIAGAITRLLLCMCIHAGVIYCMCIILFMIVIVVLTALELYRLSVLCILSVYPLYARDWADMPWTCL